jgi:L-threonylcarbamoyladenylate synthase
MTRLDVRTDAGIAAALPQVLEHLAGDGLIAYPTETVYGFGGAVTAGAAAALRRLKRRDPLKPFLLLVSGPDQAPGVQWSEASRAIARKFWPGPLTLALPADAGAFPGGIVSADGTVALRASPHPLVRALTAGFRGPITSTSANATGSPAARDCEAVIATLDALAARDVLVLDGGELPISASSTILAVDDHTVRVLRAGAIGKDELRSHLSGIGIDVQ